MATTTFTDTVTLVSASWLNDVDTSAYAYLTSPSGTNTIAATGGANLTYAAGLLVRWIPAGTNTGATTINITPSGASALGAKNVFANGVACVGGEILINVPTMAVYDGTQFNLLTPRPPVGTVASTFSFNGSGGTTGSLTIKWEKVGNMISLYIPAITQTTGTGSTTITNNTALTAAIRPTVAQMGVFQVVENSVGLAPMGFFTIGTNGIITMYRDGAGTAWTNTTAGSGSANALTVTYYLL